MKLPTGFKLPPGCTVGPAAKIPGLTPGDEPEAAFQARVIAEARLRGWLVAHFRCVRVQRRDGSCYYQTPVQADGVGFPDLVLVRPPRLIIAELKSRRGATTPEQEQWLAAFRGVPGAEEYVWRPKDWPAIERMLA